MPVVYENDCNCCEVCMGCGLRHSQHIYCDACGEEVDEPRYFPQIEEAYICDRCREKGLEEYYTFEELINNA